MKSRAWTVVCQRAAGLWPSAPPAPSTAMATSYTLATSGIRPAADTGRWWFRPREARRARGRGSTRTNSVPTLRHVPTKNWHTRCRTHQPQTATGPRLRPGSGCRAVVPALAGPRSSLDPRPRPPPSHGARVTARIPHTHRCRIRHRAVEPGHTTFPPAAFLD
jgi:hypothetical protein